jgi:hypothetical protein
MTANQKKRTILNHMANVFHGCRMNFGVVAAEHVEKAHNGSCANDPTTKIRWEGVNESCSTTA